MKIDKETFPLKVQLRVKEEEIARLRSRIETLKRTTSMTRASYDDFKLKTLRFFLDGGLNKEQMSLFKELYKEYLV